MELKLTYDGKLWGASSKNKRTDHKHELRKVFHKQLLLLWQTHPYLKEVIEPNGHGFRSMAGMPPPRKLFVYLAEQYSRLGYDFVPLVTKRMAVMCGVHILLLRPTAPGQIVSSADLDNRLKTLFDALRLPENKDELGGYNTPDADEKPFCCLLEDDKLISKLTIETDTLLQPPSADPNDVRLLITVHIHSIDEGWRGINFAAKPA